MFKRRKREAKDGAQTQAAKLDSLISSLKLTEKQENSVRGRWLDQVNWAEGRAARSQKWYRRLRIITITGGVIIPSLIGLNVTGTASEGIKWGVFGLGLLVALAAAIEGFFHYGDRWTHYRRLAEQLKTEGWQFFQLAGAYTGAASHDACYTQFAGRVETIIQADVQVFFTQVAVDKPEAAGQQANHQQVPGPASQGTTSPQDQVKTAVLNNRRARRGARNRDPG